MSTVHKLAGGLMLVTKGATDVLLDRCVVTPEERTRIEQVNEQFSNEGLRVLAFACRSVDSTAITLADENGLTFLGLIAMMDPPREESKAAVAECIRAGIRPIMTVSYTPLDVYKRQASAATSALWFAPMLRFVPSC